MKRTLIWMLLVAASSCTTEWTASWDEPPVEEGYVLPADFPDAGGHTRIVVEP